MKSKLFFFALIMLLIIPMSPVSGQHLFRERHGRNIILEMARLYSPSIRSTRSVNSYVVAFQSPNTPYISVDFGFEGQFEITISNNETEFYNNVISIDISSNNRRREQLNISISGLKQGDYVFTIKDLFNQRSAFGKFTVI